MMAAPEKALCDMGSMKIAYPISNFPLGSAGGIENYARNLIRHLQLIDDKNEYVIFCSMLNEGAFPVTNPNFKKVVEGGRFFKKPAQSKPSDTMTSAQNWKRQLTARAMTQAAAVLQTLFLFADRHVVLRYPGLIFKSVVAATHRAIFFTDQAGESGYERPFDMMHYLFTCFPHHQSHDAPVVLTMHDIQQEYFPEFFTKDQLERRAKTYRPSAEKAYHLIVISAFTKKTIVEKYGIPPEKISVVHLGYDKDAFKRLDRETVEGFRAKNRLPKRFLLYPAATWAHKNHINLVKALKILKDRHGLAEKLVLIGLKKENHDSVMDEIKRLHLNDEVISLGYIPAEDLPALYNAASVLVFPSLFEGFGMPLVEAMAVGLPVACANATCLPEIGGDAALYFDPLDPEDIAENIYAICSDERLRGSLVQKGLERAKGFTWENTARKTREVYERCYEALNKGRQN